MLGRLREICGQLGRWETLRPIPSLFRTTSLLPSLKWANLPVDSVGRGRGGGGWVLAALVWLREGSWSDEAEAAVSLPPILHHLCLLFARVEKPITDWVCPLFLLP